MRSHSSPLELLSYINDEVLITNLLYSQAKNTLSAYHAYMERKNIQISLVAKEKLTNLHSTKIKKEIINYLKPIQVEGCYDLLYWATKQSVMNNQHLATLTKCIEDLKQRSNEGDVKTTALIHNYNKLCLCVNGFENIVQALKLARDEMIVLLGEKGKGSHSNYISRTQLKNELNQYFKGHDTSFGD